MKQINTWLPLILGMFIFLVGMAIAFVSLLVMQRALVDIRILEPNQRKQDVGVKDTALPLVMEVFLLVSTSCMLRTQLMTKSISCCKANGRSTRDVITDIKNIRLCTVLIFQLQEEAVGGNLQIIFE